MSKPQRACVLIAKIEADTPQDMSAHLEQLARDIDRKELGQTSISGGYSSGHILTYSECGEPSHDEWFKDLQAHLEEKRASQADGCEKS